MYLKNNAYYFKIFLRKIITSKHFNLIIFQIIVVFFYF